MAQPVTDPRILARLMAGVPNARLITAVEDQGIDTPEYLAARKRKPGSIRDPELIKRLNDAVAIREAGGDPDKIMRSQTYRQKGLFLGDERTEGTRFESIFKGVIGDPAIKLTQLLASGIESAGIAKPLGWEGEADYYRYVPKIWEQRDQAARERQGRGGVDIARIAGALFTPLPSKGGAVARAAQQGAMASALQPVLDPERNLLAATGQQAATGAGIGALTGKILSGVQNRLVTRGQRLPPPNSTRGILEAGDRLGLDSLGYGMASTNPALRQIVNFSAKVPGGGRLVKNMDRAQEQLGAVVEGAAARIGGPSGGARSAFEIGRAGQRGGREFISNFRNRADQLYARVDNLIDPQTTVMPMNTVQAMGGRAQHFTSNPELGELLQNPRLRQFANSMLDETGQVRPLRFQEAQELRSEIGRMMGNNELINQIPRRELASVYAAISNDMQDTLRASGNTAGLNAFNRAGRYWRAGRNRIDTVMDKIIGEGVNEEKAASRIISWVNSNSRNATALRRSMPAGEWDEVASGIFRQLGELPPSQRLPDTEGFSIQKFLTDFGKLRENERAFNFAFGGTRYQQLAPVYRDLETMAGAYRRGAQLANKSQSGYYVGLAGLIGSLFVNPTLPIKIVGGNFAFAQLMARPAFARWLLRAGRLGRSAARGGARGTNALLKAHIERLPAIAASGAGEDDPAMSIYNYLSEGQQ